ncbi:hypothetical protein F0562_003821 [Nyssa sinensis]|uniref:Uncharacterized protein n=1 Tax=Nyssa sinensis TaxID=561372 RepID=A0A5J5BW89_9ASTE|nr:hypothetical protein F0562_003821 [Nyssa sinensis]
MPKILYPKVSAKEGLEDYQWRSNEESSDSQVSSLNKELLRTARSAPLCATGDVVRPAIGGSGGKRKEACDGLGGASHQVG